MSNQASPKPDRRRPESPSYGATSVEQMKKYVAQVIMVCDTMLSFFEKQQNEYKSKQDSYIDDLASSSTAAATGGSQQDEHIAFMKQKLRELVNMNITWQQSHQQQEQRIAELEGQMRQMSRNHEATNGAGVLSEKQQEEIDRQFVDQKNRYQQLEDEKLRLEDENFKLRREFDALSEKVQLLELQLSVNREDFESERRDRERAQTVVAELEQELERRSRSPYQAPAFSQYQYPAGQLYTGQGGVGNQLWNRRPALGGYMVDRHDALDVTDCVVDSPNTARGSGVTLVVDGAMVNDDQLQCPNCHSRFTRDQHEQLMDHMDRCGNR